MATWEIGLVGRDAEGRVYGNNFVQTARSITEALELAILGMESLDIEPTMVVVMRKARTHDA